MTNLSIIATADLAAHLSVQLYRREGTESPRIRLMGRTNQVKSLPADEPKALRNLAAFLIAVAEAADTIAQGNTDEPKALRDPRPSAAKHRTAELAVKASARKARKSKTARKAQTHTDLGEVGDTSKLTVAALRPLIQTCDAPIFLRKLITNDERVSVRRIAQHRLTYVLAAGKAARTARMTKAVPQPTAPALTANEFARMVRAAEAAGFVVTAPSI